MDKKEIQKRKNEIESARSALYAKIEKGEIDNDSAEAQIKELKERKVQLDQEIARAESPDNGQSMNALDFTEVRNALLEKRAVTIKPDLGGQTLVDQIFEEMKPKTPVFSLVSTYTGTNARTTIPLLYPGLAVPAGQAQGATGVETDDDAKLDSTDVTPFPFVSILPVTYDALKFNKVNFEQKLPALFASAFAQCFHKQILTGTGATHKQFEGMTGITFKAEKTTNAATTGKLTVMDLADLALAISDKTDNGTILMNSTVYAKILADSPEKDLSAVYLKTLIENKEIEGVKVVLTSHMPKDTTAGKMVAIAGEMSKYGVGYAGELDIVPKTKVGDLNVYFEAVMYAAGKPIINDFYALKAK